MRRRANSVSGTAGAEYLTRRQKLGSAADEDDDLFTYVATHSYLDGDEDTIEYYSDDEGDLDDPVLKHDRKNAVRAVRGVSAFIGNRVQRTMRNCDASAAPIFLDSEPGRIFHEIAGRNEMNDTIMQQAAKVLPAVDTKLQTRNVRIKDESGALVTRMLTLISFDAKRAIQDDRLRRRIWKWSAGAVITFALGFAILYYVYYAITSEYAL